MSDDAAKTEPAKPSTSVPEPSVTDLAPGAIRVTKDEVLVGTATHAVRLGDVAPAGRRAMPAADWARGARLGGDLVLGAAA